jgi:hypothetical protein
VGGRLAEKSSETNCEYARPHLGFSSRPRQRKGKYVMKIPSKKKVAFPRRTWQINPVTRVKSSAKKYSRPRVKRDLQKQSS